MPDPVASLDAVVPPLPPPTGTCTQCGRAMTIGSTAFTAAQAPALWVHPTLLVGVCAGTMYFLYQLGDEFSKIQSFAIYTTPPGVGDLLKLLATVVGIAAAAMGLNVKDALKNIVGGLGLGKDT